MTNKLIEILLWIVLTALFAFVILAVTNAPVLRVLL